MLEFTDCTEVIMEAIIHEKDEDITVAFKNLSKEINRVYSELYRSYLEINATNMTASSMLSSLSSAAQFIAVGESLIAKAHATLANSLGITNRYNSTYNV